MKVVHQQISQLALCPNTLSFWSSFKKNESAK